MMGSWTRQEGHPILVVERYFNNGSFKVFQAQIEDTDNTFHIPFNYASGNTSDFNSTIVTHYFSTGSIHIDAELGKDEFLILNKQSTGFYSIQYDVDNWNLIIKALCDDHTKIHALNRASLIYDAEALSLTDNLDYEVLLDLISYLRNEDEFAPWVTAACRRVSKETTIFPWRQPNCLR